MASPNWALLSRLCRRVTTEEIAPGARSPREPVAAYEPPATEKECWLASVGFEAWYYNFGPRQLLRRLVFRDGFLVREETLGYGVDEIGTLPASLNAHLEFSIAVGAHSKSPEAALAFENYVLQPKLAPLWTKWGVVR